MYFPFSRTSIELIAALAMPLSEVAQISTTVKDRTTDIDASLFDILNHTQFPKGLFQLAAFGEARYGRFGLLADIAHMKLGLERSRGVDEITARF